MRVIVILLATLLAIPSIASAQPRRRQPRQPRAAQPQDAEAGAIPTLRDLGTIVPRLSSANPDEVREAIDLLSVIDHPDVIPPIATLLRAGQPDPITDRALEALGGLAHPGAIDVLTEFTHHRREGARLRAYRALASIRDNRIPELLARGLRDSDRNVRGAAALALGEIGARDKLDILFTAFERGVVEAAISIGKLGDAASVNRYTEYLTRQPLAIMLTGYDQYLRRTDIPERVKLGIIAQLGEISGPMVKRFLQDYLRTFSERDRSAIRREVETTIRRIPDGPATPPAAAPAPAAPAPAAAPAGGGQ
jgi:HEAT repeat protein